MSASRAIPENDSNDLPESADTPEGGDPEDESPYEKTYVAIDGVPPESLSEDDIDRIERRLANVMILEVEAPITGIRVINGDTGVIEFEKTTKDT